MSINHYYFNRYSFLNFNMKFKATCTGDNCNADEIIPPPVCYQCDYSWDEYGQVGMGDERCRFDLRIEFIT